MAFDALHISDNSRVSDDYISDDPRMLNDSHTSGDSCMSDASHMRICGARANMDGASGGRERKWNRNLLL